MHHWCSQNTNRARTGILWQISEIYGLSLSYLALITTITRHFEVKGCKSLRTLLHIAFLYRAIRPKVKKCEGSN